jgi:hypothetical protein
MGRWLVETLIRRCAPGFGSLAAADGTFVCSDFSTTAGGIASTAPNQFLARTAGGFYLYSSASLKSGVERTKIRIMVESQRPSGEERYRKRR